MNIHEEYFTNNILNTILNNDRRRSSSRWIISTGRLGAYENGD
jgi:hypothetical protein